MMRAGFNRRFLSMIIFGVSGLVDKKDLEILERYVFLGQSRYRVRLKETNILFNVNAISDDEALEKALEMARKIGLNKEVLDEIRRRFSKGELKQ